MAFNFDPKQTAAPSFGAKPEPDENPFKKKKKAPPKPPASMRGLEQAVGGGAKADCEM